MLSTVLKYETRMTASVLRQDLKRITPEDSHFAFCSNKQRSFERFICFDLLSTVLGTLVIHNYSK